jgi:hypothetical protein
MVEEEKKNKEYGIIMHTHTHTGTLIYSYWSNKKDDV